MRWLIGDVHGMLKPLEALIQWVGREDSEAQLLFAGDYVNRGPDSKGVIDLLLSLTNARFIRGNHDDVFDLILHGKSYAPHGSVASPMVAFQWFMEHGLDQTLLSYGVNETAMRKCERRPSKQRLQKLLEVVPETHRTFLRNLQSSLVYPDAFVSNSLWPPASSE